MEQAARIAIDYLTPKVNDIGHLIDIISIHKFESKHGTNELHQAILFNDIAQKAYPVAESIHLPATAKLMTIIMLFRSLQSLFAEYIATNSSLMASKFSYVSYLFRYNLGPNLIRDIERRSRISNDDIQAVIDGGFSNDQIASQHVFYRGDN